MFGGRQSAASLPRSAFIRCGVRGVNGSAPGLALSLLCKLGSRLTAIKHNAGDYPHSRGLPTEPRLNTFMRSYTDNLHYVVRRRVGVRGGAAVPGGAGTVPTRSPPKAEVGLKASAEKRLMPARRGLSAPGCAPRKAACHACPSRQPTPPPWFGVAMQTLRSLQPQCLRAPRSVTCGPRQPEPGRRPGRRLPKDAAHGLATVTKPRER